MKKILAAILLLSAITASAQYPHHNHRQGWVAPAVIGGVIGYELSRPRVIVEQPIIIQQPPTMVVPGPAPIGYHWEQLLDANCRCYRMVLVQG